MSKRTAGFAGLTAIALVALAACGSDSKSSGGAKPLDKVGQGEGQVNLVAWPAYVENGSNDPSADWVTGFEKDTGCKVNVKIGNSSDEMVQLMKTGDYDAVSASGDATLRLIAAGDVAPVNTSLIPNYADVFDGLKMKPWNSKDGQAYGVPHGRGANLLMWRTDKVNPTPDSWGVVFDGASAYKGAVTAYDNPIYIADAALYLMKTKPDLGITNPYALDDTQFKAAVDLLKAQKANIGEYWSDATKQIDAFTKGSTVVGTTWQYQLNQLKAADPAVTVEAIKPTEGSTGWSDTWMVASKAKHPNCAYLWLNHIISPEANAAVAEWFGEAPSNKKSCDLTADKDFCNTFHAADEAYWTDVWYWNTPTKDCLDGRGDKCVPYAEWSKAWTEIKG